jgi:ribosomal protein S18 acetylase RimI-like enzyme
MTAHLDFTFRPLRVDDAAQVASIHLDVFTGFFLSSLGPRFLAVLYAYLAGTPDGAGFVAWNDAVPSGAAVGDGAAVGFVCGTTQPEGFYGRFFRARWGQLLPVLAWAALRRPSLVARIAWRVASPPQVSETKGGASLLSIAVLRDHQGQGLGSALVEQFFQEMQRRNVRHVHLTTDKEDNAIANRFYRQNGFQLVREFTTPEKRWMNEYAIELSNCRPKVGR